MKSREFLLDALGPRLLVGYPLEVNVVSRSMTTSHGVPVAHSVAAEKMLVAPDLDSFTHDTLVQDLSRFPEPWLNFLQDYGVQVVALKDGQTLADSPAIAREAVVGLEEWVPRVQATLSQALAALAEGDVGGRFSLAENLQDWLDGQECPFRAATHDGPVDLLKLAEQRQVAPAYREEWVSSLRQLNLPWSEQRDDGFVTRNGVFLLPPIPTAFGLLGDKQYQAAVSTTAEHISESLGLNQGPEQRVLLHPRFLAPDAPEIGEYRVAVHELGHALDYALEGLPGDTGFGKQHAAKVLACFEQATRFTSDRADDSPREYFAEAVEAYLTPPARGFDFRPDNHQAELRLRDPEMAAYLDRVFHTDPGSDWKSRPPVAQGVPEGYPDPDNDPVFLG